MFRHPQRSTRTVTLCPYTTLFRSYLCVKGALQLFAMLAVGADAIAIEGPALPDLPEDLAGAAHLAGRAVLEDEQIQFVRRIVLGGREARLGALQLAAQRFLVGGQVGEAAARQFRHFIDRSEE